jgi:hypothetical protein
VSTPLLQDFNPEEIPWQIEAVDYVENFDYSTGVLELLFSGSIGSAKSILAAHLIVMHCLENKGARALVVRRALKDLKRTLWQTIIQHMADIPQFIKAYNKSEMKITFTNGSEIIGDSYDDMNLEKFRSLELSMGVIEEASESEKELYDAIKMRIGRITSVHRNILLTLTNPGSPSHYLYTEMIDTNSPNKRVFYSLTEQNKFLPTWYVDNLRRDLDPKMVRRMLYGEWIEIGSDGIYHAYSKEKNFVNADYELRSRPIYVAFDFNIGVGKPLSVVLLQEHDGVFHCFDEIIIEGARTVQAMEELDNRGYLNLGLPIEIYGDATGASRSTKALHTDYEVITDYLKRKPNVKWVLNVPRDNPPIRERHNTVNSLCENALSQVRLKLYRKCKTLDEGLRLTAFRKGGQFIEDDSKSYQHCTTSLGYCLVYKMRSAEIKKVSMGVR